MENNNLPQPPQPPRPPQFNPGQNSSPNPINLGASMQFSGTTNSPAEKINDSGIKPIRTYESDVAEYVKDNQTSSSQIALAEQKRKLRQNTVAVEDVGSEDNKKKMLISGLILLLIIGGLLGIYMVYQNQTQSAPIVTSSGEISLLVRADSQKEINLDIINKNQFKKILTDEREVASIPLGKILGFYFTSGSGTQKALIGIDTFANLFGLTMPPSLIRSLDQNFMFGIHSFNGNAPFLILKTQSFQNAFSGMLEWEKGLADNLNGLFLDTSTLPNNQIWSDRVLFNKDARVLVNGLGGVGLLYSIIDQQTIVITNNENTFREILSRLDTARLVR